MPQINSMKDIAKALAAREGLKKQIDMAQISEILGHLSDLTFLQIRKGADKGELISQILYKNGSRRAKAKKV